MASGEPRDRNLTRMLLPLDFDYIRPATLREALDLLRAHGPGLRVLAGGTDLVLDMKRGGAKPETLLDVGRLPELRVLAVEEGFLRIGAALTFSALSLSDVVRLHAPALSDAAAVVGSPQIRALATIGGNVATSSPAGDSLPPLAAQGADICLEGTAGSRSIPVSVFLAGEGLKPGELIREIRVPVAQGGRRGVFVKLGRRNALAIARLSVALVAVRVGSGRLGDVRMALGTLGRAPVRVREAEALLTRSGLDKAVWLKAAEHASAAVSLSIPGRPTAPYKMRAVKGIVLEALERITNGGPD